MNAALNAELESLAEKIGYPKKRMPTKQFRAYLDQLYASNKFFKATADRLKKDKNLRDPMRVAYSIGARHGGWPSYTKAKKGGSTGSKGKEPEKSAEAPKAGEKKTLPGPGWERIKKGFAQIKKAASDYGSRLKGDLTYGRDKEKRKVRQNTDTDIESFKNKKRAAKEKPWRSSLDSANPPKRRRRKRDA